MADLQLPAHTIDQINDTVGKHMQAEARDRKGAAPTSPIGAIPWLMNIGGLLSKWLPVFLQILNELAAAAPAEPTLKQFFAKGHEATMNDPDPASAAA